MSEKAEKTGNNPKSSKKAEDDAVRALVRAVKDSPDAFPDLLKKFNPLILRSVKSFSDTTALGEEADPEDLRQEAALCLYNAALKYDTEQSNVTFGLYAKICLRNMLISAARKAKRRKEKKSALPPERTKASGQSPIESEDYLNLLKNAGSVLSGRECAVLKLFREGHSYIEIASALSIDVKSVDNALFRAKRKLKKLRTELSETSGKQQIYPVNDR